MTSELLAICNAPVAFKSIAISNAIDIYKDLKTVPLTKFLKIYFFVFPLLSAWSQQNLAHTNTVLLSWYVQNFSWSDNSTLNCGVDNLHEIFNSMEIFVVGWIPRHTRNTGTWTPYLEHLKLRVTLSDLSEVWQVALHWSLYNLADYLVQLPAKFHNDPIDVISMLCCCHVSKISAIQLAVWYCQAGERFMVGCIIWLICPQAKMAHQDSYFQE